MARGALLSDDEGGGCLQGRASACAEKGAVFLSPHLPTECASISVWSIGIQVLLQHLGSSSCSSFVGIFGEEHVILIGPSRQTSEIQYTEALSKIGSQIFVS